MLLFLQFLKKKKNKIFNRIYNWIQNRFLVIRNKSCEKIIIKYFQSDLFERVFAYLITVIQLENIVADKIKKSKQQYLFSI